MKGTIALAALVVVLGGLGLGHAAIRPDPNPPVIIGDDSVEARLDRMQEQLDAQHLEIIALRNKNNTLRAQVSNLIGINQHVSMVSLHGRPTVRFTGVNVQVVNGVGETHTANGTGNVIVGYDKRRSDDWLYGLDDEECSMGTDPYGNPLTTNEQCEQSGGTWQQDHKGGSHYLVVGDSHNYTTWSGIVSGWASTASSRWASVTGGYLNRATGVGASISGGRYGLAEGNQSVIAGGYENSSLGSESVVLGGRSNIAGGSSSTISGGIGNETTGTWSSVSGGGSNKANGASSSITGGGRNTANGPNSTVGGGMDLTVDEFAEWAAGN